VSQFSLAAEARNFARELSALLNGTVCGGVQLTAVYTDTPPRVVVGYGIAKREQDQVMGVPLAIGRRRPRVYLGALYRLSADAEGQHPMVESSFMGLFADSELEHPLFHYDYERNKGDAYPEAHLQVCAGSSVWSEMSKSLSAHPNREFERLHLPVGGRRFRPSLEDLIEFAVVEGLATGRVGWEKRVAEGREGFHNRQLRAAIRRNPDIAIAALKEQGNWPATPAASD